MGFLDDDNFAQSYTQFLRDGWPHLEMMIASVAPQAANMDHLSRTVLFNIAGRYLHLSADSIGKGLSIQEAHNIALAEVMNDPVVDRLVQTQLRQMIDKGVNQFQAENV